jgi:hypothetical protein
MARSPCSYISAIVLPAPGERGPASGSAAAIAALPSDPRKTKCRGGCASSGRRRWRSARVQCAASVSAPLAGPGGKGGRPRKGAGTCLLPLLRAASPLARSPDAVTATGRVRARPSSVAAPGRRSHGRGEACQNFEPRPQNHARRVPTTTRARTRSALHTKWHLSIRSLVLPHSTRRSAGGGAHTQQNKRKSTCACARRSRRDARRR